MYTRIILLAGAILLPLYASAENWSKEQMEVLKFEEACVTTTSFSDLMACFHTDFEGWGLGSTVVTTKADREKVIGDSFNNKQPEPILFKPLSVIVKGNMAVVSYIAMGKTTDKKTGEVEYSTERWTDVCLKDGGKWYWISDHGRDITNP